MKHSAVTPFLICAVLLALVFTGAKTAHAQTRIQFIVTGAHGDDAIPKACLQEQTLLWSSIQKFPHPAAWTWIISCDEAAWNKTLTRLGRERSVEKDTLALTYEDNHTTFIRGWTLINPREASEQYTPDYVVSHELAHVYLNSHDEGAVQRLADSWLRHGVTANIAGREPKE